MFSSMLIFAMLMKINSYLRITERLGLLVNLLSTCIVDIIPFTSYLMIWIGTFIILSQILGVKAFTREGLMTYDDVDEKKLSSVQTLAMTMYIWENSIGNIHDP